MHDAAEAGNLEILQELLKSGAGVSYNFFNTRRFVYSSIKICGRDSTKSFDPYLKSNSRGTLPKFSRKGNFVTKILTEFQTELFVSNIFEDQEMNAGHGLFF